MKKKLYPSIIHILNNIWENTTIKNYTPQHQKKPNEQKFNIRIGRVLFNTHHSAIAVQIIAAAGNSRITGFGVFGTVHFASNNSC